MPRTPVGDAAQGSVFNHVGGFPAAPGWLSGGSFEGHERLVQLDNGNPEVVDFRVVACFPLETA